ncbi:hypothetical protein P3T37_003728 [Kitasatospora sp. MAA4]|uniref:hypothetical protein n=1 Tax=Kitasatospora sp. MAA4 TaxID=3035093 RepID=UPI002473A03E|nr:hypothetical protein [Kitasatospora sp. MAA4]MDH6134325.1 hypothetical protein [Kitasatospora sp. MAA4]
MVSPGRHQKSAVAAALDKAKGAGFEVRPDKNGHRWGWVICCGCHGSFKVAGTPRDPDTEAKKILQFVSRHSNC